jgi:hypothetical protein
MKLRFGDRIMKKLLIAAAFVMAGTSAALTQGYVYYGMPYYAAPYAYTYVPAYAPPTPVYYAPGVWYRPYGANDISGNSVRQPNPRSTIEAVR